MSHTRWRIYSGLVLTALIWMGLSGTASAISVTASTDPMLLGQTMTQFGGAGLIVTSATLQGHIQGAAVSSGTYTNASGTYSIALGPGIVLSAGNVLDYGAGPNTVVDKSTAYGGNLGSPATASQEALLDPITGGPYTHYDVTQLDVTFDMVPGYDTVYFNVVFGSEEYPEWVGSTFVDGFGLYVNSTNIAFVDGSPVNINHPAMAAIAGTELDGILNDRIPHTFQMLVGDGSVGNTLSIIIADTSDSVWDPTVYVSQLGGSPPPVIPEPLTVLSVVGGFAALGRYLRRRAMR